MPRTELTQQQKNFLDEYVRKHPFKARGKKERASDYSDALKLARDNLAKVPPGVPAYAAIEKLIADASKLADELRFNRAADAARDADKLAQAYDILPDLAALDVQVTNEGALVERNVDKQITRLAGQGAALRIDLMATFNVIADDEIPDEPVLNGTPDPNTSDGRDELTQHARERAEWAGYVLKMVAARRDDGIAVRTRLERWTDDNAVLTTNLARRVRDQQALRAKLNRWTPFATTSQSIGSAREIGEHLTAVDPTGRDANLQALVPVLAQDLKIRVAPLEKQLAGLVDRARDMLETTVDQAKKAVDDAVEKQRAARGGSDGEKKQAMAVLEKAWAELATAKHLVPPGGAALLEFARDLKAADDKQDAPRPVRTQKSFDMDALTGNANPLGDVMLDDGATAEDVQAAKDWGSASLRMALAAADPNDVEGNKDILFDLGLKSVADFAREYAAARGWSGPDAKNPTPITPSQEATADAVAKGMYAEARKVQSTKIDPAAGELTIGGQKFKRKQELGKGGMGVAFRYETSGKPPQVVVVKSMNDPAKREEMVKELRNHRQLMTGDPNAVGRANVVEMIDAVQGEDGSLHTIMEVVDGGDLALNRYAQDVANENKVIPDEVRSVLNQYRIKQAAIGLKYMRDQNLVHFDVKDANFFIAGDGTVKVADFGSGVISDQADGTVAKSDAGESTAGFEAPDKNQVTSKFDSYALGQMAVLMESGAGSMKDGHDAAEIQKGGALSRLTASLTSKDPRDRMTLEGVLESSYVTNVDGYDEAAIKELNELAVDYSKALRAEKKTVQKCFDWYYDRKKQERLTNVLDPELKRLGALQAAGPLSAEDATLFANYRLARQPGKAQDDWCAKQLEAMMESNSFAGVQELYRTQIDRNVKALDAIAKELRPLLGDNVRKQTLDALQQQNQLTDVEAAELVELDQRIAAAGSKIADLQQRAKDLEADKATLQAQIAEFGSSDQAKAVAEEIKRASAALLGGAEPDTSEESERTKFLDTLETMTAAKRKAIPWTPTTPPKKSAKPSPPEPLPKESTGAKASTFASFVQLPANAAWFQKMKMDPAALAKAAQLESVIVKPTDQEIEEAAANQTDPTIAAKARYRAAIQEIDAFLQVIAALSSYRLRKHLTAGFKNIRASLTQQAA